MNELAAEFEAFLSVVKAKKQSVLQEIQLKINELDEKAKAAAYLKTKEAEVLERERALKEQLALFEKEQAALREQKQLLESKERKLNERTQQVQNLISSL